MNDEGLNDSYARLRDELDAAYSATHWDSQRIDLITERMAPIERALALLASEEALEQENAHE